MIRLTIALALVPLAFAVPPSAAQAKQRENVLYAFTGSKDGKSPYNGLIRDKTGNLYGATYAGGAGMGVVFQVAPDGSQTVLHAFAGKDGSGPASDLIADKKGNLYGTTTAGGSANQGVIFSLKPGGRERVLYAFKGGTDGGFPVGALLMDKGGNIYGTTQYGGGACNCGTVFKLAPDGTETLLHVFAEGKDGAYPVARLYRDKAGNLFGTTYEGGGSSNCGQYGCGTVFEISAAGKESVLHGFVGTDGALPNGGLVADKTGNLYGTTFEGGGSSNCQGGCGAVYKLADDGSFAVLHAFTGSDGANPGSDLLAAGKGGLYGTSVAGGAANLGTVFAVKADGSESVLYSFASGSDGANPISDLVAGAGGELYGTTSAGGTANAGTVFSVKK